MNASSALGARCGLDLPGAPPVSPDPLVPDAWEALIGAAVRERAVPLVAHAVDVGLLPASPAQRAAVAVAHEEAMRLCVLLERATLETTRVLAGAGIPLRLLKGPAVAHLDYRDPALRAFGDIDLLVPSAAYDDAVHALEAVGARRRFPQVHPGFDRRFGKGVCMVTPDGMQVDLHRTFVAGPFGLTVDLDDLFAGRATVALGGEAVPVLDRPHRFLHACYHAALGDEVPRVVALRDVAQMLLTTDLDVERARATARAWHAEAVVARAVVLAWERLALAPAAPLEWARTYVADRFESRSLGAYTGPGRSYARQMAAGVYAVRGLPAKLAYVRSLLVVDPEYARRHDGGYSHRLRRAWSARRGGEPVR